MLHENIYEILLILRRKIVNVDSFVSVRAIRFSTAEQFFLVATRCSHGHRPLIFFITLLFTVLVVS